MGVKLGIWGDNIKTDLNLCWLCITCLWHTLDRPPLCYPMSPYVEKPNVVTVGTVTPAPAVVGWNPGDWLMGCEDVNLTDLAEDSVQ